MNCNHTGDNSPTRDSESGDKNELVSRIERLEQVVNEQSETIEELTEEKDELRQDVEKLTEEKDELNQDVEKQSERIGELEGQKDELEETVQDQKDEIEKLKEDRNTAGKVRADIKSEIHTLQESLEGGSSDTTPPTDGGTTIQEHNLKPIEQISRADSDNLDEVIDSPSVRRAVSLFQNIMDWGSRTPKGVVLKSSDNPLSLLSADMDESLCWKQYYRAASALEGLSEGAVTFVNSDRHGKMLILHEHSDVYQRMKNGTLTSSTVGAKG